MRRVVSSYSITTAWTTIDPSLTLSFYSLYSTGAFQVEEYNEDGWTGLIVSSLNGFVRADTSCSKIRVKSTSGTITVKVTLLGLAVSSGTTPGGDSINWLGAWSSGVTYEENDAVSNDGSSYICTATNLNQEPPNASYWDLLAAKGDTGSNGSNGTNGTNGSNGADGSTWFEDAGIPSDSFGALNDLYLNITNGDVYKRGASTWGSPVGNIKGSAGANGADGADGSNGSDGADGAPGSAWFEGSGVPSDGSGINGDFYLNISNGDVYQKAGGTWGAAVGNIKGATGSPGPSTITPPTVNQTAEGLHDATMVAGETLTAGQVVYEKSDGKQWKAKADSATTIPADGLVITGGAADATVDILRVGYYKDNTWSWTVGGLIYVDPANGGGLTQTLPTTSGHQVQIVGRAISTTVIYFKPDYTYLELI